MPGRPISPAHVAFGAAVRAARKRIDPELSQERLGHEAGLDRTYVSDIERGSRNVSYSSLLKIAAGLRMKLSELQADAERRAS